MGRSGSLDSRLRGNDSALLRPEQFRQGGERGGDDIRLARKWLRRLAGAVAPEDPHAEGRGGIGVPAVRGLERDRAGRQAEPVERELIDFGMRLEDADLLDR